MKKIIPLLALVMLLNAQKSFSVNSVDSLLNVLRTTRGDTTRVNTLNLLAREYHNRSNLDEAKKNVEEALQLAKKIGFKKGEASAHLGIGVNHFYRGNYAEALKNYSVALKISEEIGNKSGIAKSYNNMGLVYTYQGNFEEGKKSHLAALKAFTELKDTAGMANSYNNLGIIYDEQGNYPEALKAYYGALKIVEKKGDKKALADVYVNIGLVYSNLDNYDEALKNYERSLALAKEVGYKQGIANCYGNLSIAYKHKKDFPKALEYNQKVIKMSEETGDKSALAMAYEEIGDTYSDMEKNSEAIRNTTEGLKLFIEMGDKVHESVCYGNLGYIYRRQKQYAKAIDNFNKALALQTEAGAKERMSNTYGLISDVYRDIKDYDNAYKYVKLYQELHDSLYNETNSKQMAEMKTKYETEKKDAEIVLLNKDKEVETAEIKKQKTLKYSFISGLALLALLSVVVFRNFSVRNKLKLQTLRNKIASDLHDDVGSTLSSIAIFSEVAQQQTKEVVPMLNTISESARKMLDAMADIVWTINPENDQFEKIILRMRSFAYELLGAKKIDFEFNADESAGKMKLPMDVRKSLYLIFKEATNNMVKYSEANKASFSIKGEKNELTMLIRDNGKGFDINTLTQGNGIKNMRKRAQEIGAKLLIESIPDSGTTVQLMISV